MPDGKPKQQLHSQIERLEINSIRFSIEASIALLGAATAHHHLGDGTKAREASTRARGVFDRIEPRLRGLPTESDHVEWLWERLLELKRRLLDFEARSAGIAGGEAAWNPGDANRT